MVQGIFFEGSDWMNYEQVIDERFNGVVSIKHNGERIFQKPFGYADLPNKVPNGMDTKFPTASAGKAFVAVAVLQLIEKGKLSFETRIGDVLAFNLGAIDLNITVRQLLNHTSGIPDYFDESVMDEYAGLWEHFPNYKIRTSKDLLPLFIDKPMMYEPGEKFQYNNSGFVVLGLIIEAITGLAFDVYLKKNVFEPAGMSDTGYYELDRLPAKCANAYIYDKNRREYYTNIFSVDAKGTGAGGAFTTVADVEDFWDKLLNHQLISSNMVNKMLSPQVAEKCYGYGIWLDEKKNGAFSYHFEGCDPGVSFYSVYDPGKDLLITSISNFGDNVWKVFQEISKAFKEKG